MSKLNVKTIAIIGGLVLGGAIFWPSPSAKDEARQRQLRKNLNPASSFARAAGSDLIRPADSSLIMQKVRDGRINLVQELNRLLRERCSEQLSKESCRDAIRDYIAQLDEPARTRLADLFDTYLDYKQAEYALQFTPNANINDRFQAIKALRREHFGQEDAQLVFGLEESYFEFRGHIHSVLTGSVNSNLSTAQAVQSFKAKRREIFGPYYETISDADDASIDYGIEYIVRSQELEGLSPEDRAEAIYKMRAEHFGEDAAEEMNEMESEKNEALTARSQRMDDYISAEAEFLAANPNLEGEAKRAALAEFKASFFDDGELTDID